MRALGYTRLSQVSDTSIKNQKQNIRDYATQKGWDLVDVLDDGERASGFDVEGREAYQTFKDKLPKTDVVIVNDKRRLARDTDEVMRLIPTLRERGIELHTCQDGQVDLEDPVGASLEILAAALASKEKKRDIDKARAAVKARQEAGYHQGRVPFGLRLNDEKHLERDPEDWPKVKQILNADVVKPVAEELGVKLPTAYSIARRDMDWYTSRLER